MNIKNHLLQVCSPTIQNILNTISYQQFEKIEEIRIRVNQPLFIKNAKEEQFITPYGKWTSYPTEGYICVLEDISLTLELMSDYSLYAFEEEIKHGYLTLPGGHRVGLTGRVIIENGQVKNLKYINGLNIRISHEKIGCADPIIPYVISGNSVYHTLIVSPPGCGKTTLLRDLIRQISNGIPKQSKGYTVGVVDERSEIAGCYQGLPQKNIGFRTDVLDGCPKVEGMMMLLRSMAPEIIAVDEIGSEEDIYAIENVLNAGCKIFCTVHGNSIEDLKTKPVLSALLHKKIFERIIFLSHRCGPGTLEKIMDGTNWERTIL
ncbi:MAG: stage III sporulation protein AA [Epulopiscium sp.]|mgnify:FL=1|nr:stage III sporulation protein AA [Candidatus Epulonipiscium sp.]